MSPFALHTRFEGFVSLLAAAVASLSILGSVVYVFVDGGVTPAPPGPKVTKSAAAAASAPAPALAGTLDPY